MIIFTYPDQYLFGNEEASKNLQTLICSGIEKNQALTDTIDKMVSEGVFRSFGMQLEGDFCYPGTNDLADFFLSSVDADDEFFDNRTVKQEPEGNFTLLISAKTSQGIPLKIQLFGSKRPYITPIYPYQFRVQEHNERGKIRILNNRTYDGWLKDTLSILLNKKEITRHLRKGNLNERFTWVSDGEIKYPFSKQKGRFEATLVRMDEIVPPFIKVFPAEIWATVETMTNQGVSLTLSLIAKKSS